MGTRVRLGHTPASLGFALTRLVGQLLRDVVLTLDEVDGLTADLLTSGKPRTGTTNLGWPTGSTTTRTAWAAGTCRNSGVITAGEC